MPALKELFNKYQCDKSAKHGYHEVYEKLFGPKRNDPINFLEIGIFKGASTAALHEYFPNGTICGIDLFVREKENDLPILNEERVKYVKGDSMSYAITGLLSSEIGIEYDYILDDGAHYPEANMLTFRHMSPLLKSGGLYIIEDVWPLEIMNKKELSHPWIKRFPDRYNALANEAFLNEMDKSGFAISRYDLRKKSGEPDSYIIVLEKE